MRSSFFYVFFLVFLCIFGIENLYAGPEEDACFDILSQKANDLYNIDLTKVNNGVSNKVDISTYKKFQSKKYKSTDNPTGFFNSQRNNIGTIILGSNYITTQYVSIGQPTNFKFPTTPQGTLIGDEFTNFRNQMVYTHHNIFNGGAFLSCGYLRITPYSGYSLYDLDPTNYFTNIIDGGGFEIESSREVDLGDSNMGHFIVGKSVVQGATRLGSGSGTILKKLFKIDIINVVYDNGSQYFNEYETYPLQVDTMTNADVYTTAWSLQQDFADRVMNQTCLSSVHPGIGTLPEICSGEYASRSSLVRSNRSFAFQGIPSRDSQESFFSNFFHLIIPQTSAALEKDELMEVQSRETLPKENQGNTIMMDSNFDYFQYKKINSLPSKSLRDYTLAAASYQFDADLQKLFESSGVLSEYESVFLGCGIPYNERVALIKKWIATIDISNFSVDTIEYPDPRMGDCMIPFPDRRNADKIIPGSFESNQQYARYLNNLKSGSVDPRINELKQEMQKLEKEYAVEIDKANSLISLGQVLEGKKLLSEASAKYEPQLEKIQNSMRMKLNPNLAVPVYSNAYLSYGLIFFGLFLCLMIVYILRRNKPQKIPNP